MAKRDLEKIIGKLEDIHDEVEETQCEDDRVAEAALEDVAEELDKVADEIETAVENLPDDE
jgi:hypothetical protein